MTSLLPYDASNRSVPLPPSWEPYLAADYWVAERHNSRLAFLIHVSPEGDWLPVAIDTLVPLERQPEWVVTYAADTPDGWSLYHLMHLG